MQKISDTIYRQTLLTGNEIDYERDEDTLWFQVESIQIVSGVQSDILNSLENRRTFSRIVGKARILGGIEVNVIGTSGGSKIVDYSFEKASAFQRINLNSGSFSYYKYNKETQFGGGLYLSIYLSDDDYDYVEKLSEIDDLEVSFGAAVTNFAPAVDRAFAEFDTYRSIFIEEGVTNPAAFRMVVFKSRARDLTSPPRAKDVAVELAVLLDAVKAQTSVLTEILRRLNDLPQARKLWPR